MRFNEIYEQPVIQEPFSETDFDVVKISKWISSTKVEPVTYYKDYKLVSKNNHYVLLDTNNIPVFYAYVEMITDHNNKEIGPSVKNIFKNSDHTVKGFSTFFYFNVLMKKYKIVFSGDMQTDSGFNLWKRLFKYTNRYKNFGVYNTNTNELTVITSIEKLDHYRKDTHQYSKYLFYMSDL